MYCLNIFIDIRKFWVADEPSDKPCQVSHKVTFRINYRLISSRTAALFTCKYNYDRTHTVILRSR